MERFEQPEILLVADNPADAESSIRALKSEGLGQRLMWFNAGRAALDFLHRRDDRQRVLPRLVLIDLTMTVMDSIDVLWAIRADERTKMLPVGIMTASDEVQQLCGRYGLPANSCSIIILKHVSGFTRSTVI